MLTFWRPAVMSFICEGNVCLPLLWTSRPSQVCRHQSSDDSGDAIGISCSDDPCEDDA